MAKFKTRARALDMLGRQQIAGIPTAISELFKNAYDAYACDVQADYFRTHNLFILSDNGIGMTPDDFENKWLALGTDSKYKSNKNIAVPAGMTQRPTLGEKGIGRLAISTIGPQVLILSRAKRENNLSELVVAYIHWGVFELPGINLEDIDIPVKTFPLDSFPNSNDIMDLINLCAETVKNISSKINDEKIEEIYKDIDEAKKILDFDLWDEMIKEFSLKNNSGTQFYIPTADKELLSLLQDYNDINKCSILVKQLSGFFNTITKSKNDIEMNTVFNYHKTIDSSDNIIDNSWFWTYDDFSKMDLFIKGCFDDNGFFSGILRYGGISKEYKINCNSNANKISCSGFDFTLGFIHGEEKESKLIQSEYKEYKNRALRIGGIYIYKNNIRILPYGIPEFDFLELERIRTYRAADFWFSHRRVIGVVELFDKNLNLQEKAGREGFREGKAYHDFKNTLITLLQNVMQDIKTDSELSKEKEDRKQRSKQLKAIEEQEKHNKKILKEFVRNIRKLSSKIEKSYLIETENEINKFEDEEAKINLYDDNFAKFMAFNKLIEDLKEKLNLIYKDYNISKPQGIALDKNIEYEFDLYISKLEEYKLMAQEKYNEYVINTNKHISDLKEFVDQKQFFKDRLESLKIKLDNFENLKTDNFNNIIAIFKDILNSIIEKSLSEAISEIQELKDDIAYILDNLYKENFEFDIEKLNICEQKIDTIEKIYINLFKILEDTIRNIFNYSETNKELYTVTDREEYYQSKLQAYKDSFEMDFDLVQRGLAIDIINHEFAKEVRTIRQNITRLKKWSEYNENILDIYQNIYNGFTHLDNYLGLFTQMQRRLYKEAIEISGRKINNHIEAVFKEKLEEYGISLNVSKEFINHSITAYPSTIFPVFVNLVDNAIFWVKDREKREIILDIDNNQNYIIQDSGPGISKNDEFVIFERGFSRKELGRGLGLYICKEALNKEGFDIRVDNPGEKGARFVIYKKNSQITEEIEN